MSDFFTKNRVKTTLWAGFTVISTVLILLTTVSVISATSYIYTDSQSFYSNGYHGDVSSKLAFGTGGISGDYTYYAKLYVWSIGGASGSCKAYAMTSIPSWDRVFDRAFPYDTGWTESGSVSGVSGYADNCRAHLYIDLNSASAQYWHFDYTHTLMISDSSYKLSGNIGCIDTISLYVNNSGSWITLIDAETVTGESSYSYNISDELEYKIVFDGAYYYDFTCTGNEVFNYDVCLYVYGYTCGIEHIKLWKDDGGWVLEDTYYHATIGVNPYEMQITDGNDYKLNFSDGHEYLFSCTGSHVLYDWDRCPWVYPPSPWVDPVPIVIYVGYDNRIVLLQDAHGNFIEHSQIAVYDQTDDIYLQKWTDNPEGYLVLAARYDTDHDVQIAVRTFDSVHTTTTIYPMNGTAENLTWTNWTIPIMYNIQMEPVDTYNVPLFDVFCGLAEYTPINPLSFWGMDFNRGYVPVTNCSGFSRCDIIAEKGGYHDFEITGLNWTSKSAMTKDYRHTITMTKE